MMKKIILAVVVLGLAGGGFFYWWNNQADVRGLNKGLPKGVMVAKSFFGNGYKVINKIDGYEFKVPREWKNSINNIDYLPLDKEIFGYHGSSINIGSMNGTSGAVIDYFKTNGNIENLKKIVGDMLYNIIGFEEDLAMDSIGELEIIKTQENSRIFDNFMYFFKKDSIIYGVASPSEDFIKYIIANGKW